MVVVQIAGEYGDPIVHPNSSNLVPGALVPLFPRFPITVAVVDTYWHWPTIVKKRQSRKCRGNLLY